MAGRVVRETGMRIYRPEHYQEDFKTEDTSSVIEKWIFRSIA
jgi:hypothetical protein